MRWTLLVLALVWLAGCGTAPASPQSGGAASEAAAGSGPKTELVVSAAASLTDVLKDIQKAFEEKNPDIRLSFNFGSSGALQQQIEQGAPADLFVSAGKKQMNALVEKRLIDKEAVSDLLANELVLVVSKEKPAPIKAMADLAGPEVKKLAIGEPETVPAGGYAKEALQSASLWEKLQPRLLPAKDVRQVLTYVETGNAEAGFVYRSDAALSDKVTVALAADPSAHSPIVYPAGIVKATRHRAEAGRLYEYLSGNEAAASFAKYGFRPAAAAAGGGGS